MGMVPNMSGCLTRQAPRLLEELASGALYLSSLAFVEEAFYCRASLSLNPIVIIFTKSVATLYALRVPIAAPYFIRMFLLSERILWKQVF